MRNGERRNELRSVKTRDATEEDKRRSKCRLGRGWAGRASGHSDLQDACDLPEEAGEGCSWQAERLSECGSHTHCVRYLLGGGGTH